MIQNKLGENYIKNLPVEFAMNIMKLGYNIPIDVQDVRTHPDFDGDSILIHNLACENISINIKESDTLIKSNNDGRRTKRIFRRAAKLLKLRIDKISYTMPSNDAYWCICYHKGIYVGAIQMSIRHNIYTRKIASVWIQKIIKTHQEGMEYDTWKREIA